MPHIAFIAIGSNLGNPAEQCHRALCKLENTEGITLACCSSFYPTDPLVPDGVDHSTVPAYVNAVCEISTTLTPELLLARLLVIEKEMGRERREKWESRIIDLDLLFYDDLVFHTNTLRVPHPEIQNRRFVLEPLCEIAPQWIHPVHKRTVREMAGDLSSTIHYSPSTIHQS
ncbi:MAG: 2-amino-4-hydroxy-6-hydroxymethyldihydropteridine diphosphokinase [Deltaproteobacteria bacterium]|nr:2-amino-4-hydroxy-6-hydroxymethyldihydropteridine diphosphokinase [Deltaproteobacteria bacterium]